MCDFLHLGAVVLSDLLLSRSHLCALHSELGVKNMPQNQPITDKQLNDDLSGILQITLLRKVPMGHSRKTTGEKDHIKNRFYANFSILRSFQSADVKYIKVCILTNGHINESSYFLCRKKRHLEYLNCSPPCHWNCRSFWCVHRRIAFSNSCGLTGSECCSACGKPPSST